MKRSPTCAHCVVTRAVARLGRRQARPFTLGSCSTQAPLVAMDGPELYALVSHFFCDAAESWPGDGPVRLRIVSGAHPEIQILAATGAARSTLTRTLAIPRHADGSLTGGFAEFCDEYDRSPTWAPPPAPPARHYLPGVSVTGRQAPNTAGA